MSKIYINVLSETTVLCKDDYLILLALQISEFNAYLSVKDCIKKRIYDLLYISTRD